MVNELEQVDQQEEQQQDPPSKRRVLYDAVSKEFNLGTFDEFNQKIQNPEKRKLLYDKVGAKYNLGTFDEFNKKLDEGYSTPQPEPVKKKVGSVDFENSSLASGNGLSPSQSQSNGEIPTVSDYGNGELVPDDDVVEIAKRYTEGKNATKPVSEFTMGMSQGKAQPLPDEEKRSASEAMAKDLRERGYDPDKLNADFDFPEYVFQSIPKQKLIQDYKDNPQLYEREIATAKWQSKLKEAAPELSGKVQESLINITDPTIDYETKRSNVKDIVRSVNESKSEDKEDILKNLSTDLSNVYIEGALNNKKEPENSAAKNLSNPSDMVAFDFMSDILPKEANRYRAAFLDDADIKNNPDAQLQKQIAQKGLAETRIRMQKSFAQEKLNPILKELQSIQNKEQITPEDEVRVQQLVSEGKKYDDILNAATAEEDAIPELYPKASYLDANNFAQELLGQKHSGLGWMAIEMGKATDNTMRGIKDWVTTPFINDHENQINQAEILGNAALNENSAYLKQSNQISQNFKPEVSPELQSDIDAIKNNSNLSDRQKLDAVSDLLTSRPSEWRRTPIKGGNTNLGISSLMYGIGGLAADLAPFMLAEMATGGGATAGVLRKFTSTFASAAATGFHEAYVEALKNGEENPFATATRVTAINSAAMAGANTPGEIRKLLGNKTAIGKLVGGMTDDAIEAALKQQPKALSGFKKGFDLAKQSGKKLGSSALEGFKTGGKVTGFITAGQIANDAISGELKTPVDYAKQAAIETLKFGLFGTGVGIIGKIRKPSDLSLASVIDAGKNPEGYELALKTLEKDNQITPDDAAQVRRNIEVASKVVSDPVFKTLSEKGKREFMYNTLAFERAKEAEKSLPPKQAAEAAHQKMVAEYKNELLLDKPTDNQLDSRLRQIEKELTPEKKEDGTVVPINEKEKAKLEAERDAINDVIEDRLSEIDKSGNMSIEEGEEISQPIEPTQKDIYDDLKNNRLTTVEYNSENEIPDVWKDKVSSSGETNGNKIFRITLPTSQFEYESKTGISKKISEYPETRIENNNPEEGSNTLSEVDVRNNPIVITPEMPVIEVSGSKPYVDSLVKLGYDRAEAEAMTIEQRQHIAENKIQKPEVVSSAKIMTNEKAMKRDLAKNEADRQFDLDEATTQEEKDAINKKYDDKAAEIKDHWGFGEKDADISPEENTTSIKNEVTKQERESRGLKEIEVEARRSFGEVFDRAKKQVDSGEVDPRVMAAELAKKPRALNAEESAALLYDRMRIANDYDVISEKLLKAKELGNEPLVAALEDRLAKVESDMAINDEAARKTGYEQGLGLAIRRLMIKRDYSLAALVNKYKIANGGKEISPEIRQRLNDMVQRLQEAEKKLEEYENRVKELETEVELKKQNKKSRKKTDKEYSEERENIKKSIAKKWNNSKNVGISPDLKNDLFTQIAPDIAKLVKSYAAQGVVKLSEVIDKVYDDLSNYISGITKEDVKDIIIGKYDAERTKKEISRTELELRANVEKVRKQIDLEKEKLRLAQRTKGEKIQDYFHKWRRFALLSGVKVLGKIGVAAAMRSHVISPIESGLGALLSKTKIGKGAPREGRLSPKAEAAAFTQWVDKMTYKDIGNILKGEMGELDYLHHKELHPTGGWLEFFGQLHSAIKTLPKRAEYFRSLQMRTEFALKEGKDLSDPAVQMELTTKAYDDALRAIFMNDNYITDAYKSLIKSIENSEIEGSGIASNLLKFLFPIVKVPTNYVAESTSYMIGGLKAAYALRKGVSKLTPDQKDYILRNLKKQSVGAAFIALGYFNPDLFGGYYTGKRKQSDELAAGDLKMFGVVLPHWMSHTPLLEALQLGATLRRVNDSMPDEGTGKKFIKGLTSSIKGVSQQIPFVNTPGQISEAAGSADAFNRYIFRTGQSVIEPQLIKEIAELSDTTHEKRDPKTFLEQMKTGIPGLRQDVPLKEYKTFEIKEKGGTQKRQATKEEAIKAEQEIDNRFSERMKEIKENGVYLDKYGDVTLDEREAAEEKPYSELSEDDIKKVKRGVKEVVSKQVHADFDY